MKMTQTGSIAWSVLSDSRKEAHPVTERSWGGPGSPLVQLDKEKESKGLCPLFCT